MAKSTSIFSLVAASTLVSAMAGTPASAPAAGLSAPIGINGAARPCICFGSHSGSQDNSFFTGNLSLAYDSTFFCRGMDMGDDMFSATLDLDLHLSQDLTLAITGRYLTVDETGFDESHLYTGLFYRVGNVSFGPSVRWYHNFNGGMMENAYDLGFQTLVNAGPIDIKAGYYYETESEGSFFELGLSSNIKLTEKVSLVPAAEIGYTDGWMMPIHGWNNVLLRLSVPIKATDNATVTPWIGANLPLEALEGGQDDKLVAGVSLNFSF